MKEKRSLHYLIALAGILIGVCLDQFTKYLAAVYLKNTEGITLIPGVLKLQYLENEKVWLVNNEYKAKNVINTTPWPDLYTAMGKPAEIREQIAKIKYNKRL